MKRIKHEMHNNYQKKNTNNNKRERKLEIGSSFDGLMSEDEADESDKFVDHDDDDDSDSFSSLEY